MAVEGWRKTQPAIKRSPIAPAAFAAIIKTRIGTQSIEERGNQASPPRVISRKGAAKAKTY
jgi:hypothetical protein